MATARRLDARSQEVPVSTQLAARPTFDHTPGAPTLKRPAFASRGMVTSNHPLASLAGNEILLQGGNAVDAAIGTMFALSVVEPMMVTIFGAGFVNIRQLRRHSRDVRSHSGRAQPRGP